MNNEILKTIILEQHEVIKASEIISRDVCIDKNDNRILVGIRRSGKTTLLYRLVKELISEGIDWKQIIYINFEDERLVDFTSDNFNSILSVKSEFTDKEGWYFFDEIQNIANWEKFCRRMADAKHHVFITGSNAKMLSREMESTLGGRYLSTLIFPYSFTEFLKAKNIRHDKDSILITSQTGRILNAFDEYLHFGGFPENTNRNNKREYLSSVYNKVLEGDIISRHDIRNAASLRFMVKKIAESVKDPISFNRLSSILKGIGININTPTVIDYISYMEDAYLIFPIRNWFAAFAEKESAMKHYFTDTGILSLFLIDKPTLLLENIVATILYRMYKDNVFFIKSARTGLDIDFYLPDSQILIQVAYSLDENSKEREVNALLKAKKLMEEIKNMVILTYDEKDVITIGDSRIEAIPVWKWLLKI